MVARGNCCKLLIPKHNSAAAPKCLKPSKDTRIKVVEFVRVHEGWADPVVRAVLWQ
jgi:hypothetical protein